MHAKSDLPQDFKDRLLTGLSLIPPELVLTPLLWNKAPYREKWQSEEPVSRQAIAADIRSGKAGGYGLRTGPISGGILAIDLDGPSAEPKILEISGGKELPKTVGFTSGRPGRSQHLYSVPEKYWPSIKTKKIRTGATGDDGKPEQVEFRWSGCQSVLPYSAHPTTAGYDYLPGCAPGECEIAIAPMWVIEQMLTEAPQDPVPSSNKPIGDVKSTTSTSKWSDRDWALNYLNALSPSRADNYDEWLQVGMALQSVDDSFLNDWDKWSQQSQKYKSGACEKKWKTFKSSGVSIGSLAHLAKQDGWRPPAKQQQQQKLHQKTIDEVGERADADILNIIGEHISLQKRGKDFVGVCPFHIETRLPSSRSPSLIVNEQKQFFSCTECATNGNSIRFLTVFGKHSFQDVVLDLARRYQVQPRSSDGATITLPATPLTFEKPVIGVPEGNVVDYPTASRRHQLISEDELHQRIDDLISQDLQPSKLTAKLSLLAKETGLQPADIKRIYYEREQEKEQAESRPECAAEIEDLLKVGISSLKLAEELPAIYAQPLIKLAKYLSLREEVYLLALLSALSVCHRSGTKLIIHRGQGFSVPLNLFAAIVSESGQRKSPVIKEIITTPLRVLQREAKAEHQAAIAKYEADLENWNSLDKDGREVDFPNGIPQEPPRQKIYFFTSTSGSEAINRQIDAHPDQPLIYLKDEVMGVFTQQGKYTQGRGSEKQDFLSYYDGTGATELLTDGVRSDTEIILMSIFGSVQPEVLRKFTKDCSDPDGQWARFLWVNQPLAAATLQDDDGGSINITDLLAGLYRQTCALPAIEYTLSSDALKVYQKAYNRIEQLRINCPDPGMRAVYSKATGQLGRLIGNCHVIYELAAEREPSAEIPVERVRQGIRLIKFFIEQAKIIRSEGNASKGELPDILAKIIRLSQRLGRLKAKQVQKNYESIKLTPDQIRNTFLELQAMGYGPTYGKGNRMEWEYQPQIDPPNRQAGGEGNDDDGGSPKKYNLSPTAPTAPTGGENHDNERVSAVGDSPTISPTAPTVLLADALEQEDYDAAWISVKGGNGTFKQVVGETVGAVGGTVGKAPTAESTQPQGFQETVGAVGAVGVFPQKSIQKEDCHISVGESCNLSVPSPTAPTANYCQRPGSTEAPATALEVEVGDESQPAEWSPQIGDRVWRTAFGYPEGPYVITTRPGDKFMVVNDGLPYEKTARYYRLRAADGNDTAIYECGKVEHLRPVGTS